jgi:hypothetical protein
MEDDPGEHGAIRVDMIGSNSLHKVYSQHSRTSIVPWTEETTLTAMKMDIDCRPIVREDSFDSPEGPFHPLGPPGHLDVDLLFANSVRGDV